MIVFNVWIAGAWFQAWSGPQLSEPVWAVLAGLLMAGSLFSMARATAPAGPSRVASGQLLLATGTGIGYGCFSALWHCCPPLWTMGAASNVIFSLVWLAALPLGLGGIGRVCAARSAPAGELMGAMAFALVYPWHSPAFFLQCLLGGALATWLVRKSGSGWAPILFLVFAYVCHMSLPFLGWVGAAIALALVATHAAAAVRWQRVAAADGTMS
jgi:hypothetical protein